MLGLKFWGKIRHPLFNISSQELWVPAGFYKSMTIITNYVSGRREISSQALLITSTKQALKGGWHCNFPFLPCNVKMICTPLSYCLKVEI